MGGDGEETLALVRAHARGDERNDAIQTAMQFWIINDSENAEAWLLEQEPSPDRDQMILGFLNQLRPRDPASKTEWIERIHDEDLRERTRTPPPTQAVPALPAG